MVELAFPILVIKTFNNWLLKFIGNLVSVLSVVVPHCIQIIYFPIAFKTKCYLLIGVDSYGYNMLVLNNPTLNNFKAYGRGFNGNLSVSAVGGYGIFIGK